jgi:hypothetical protein
MEILEVDMTEDQAQDVENENAKELPTASQLSLRVPVVQPGEN